MEDISDLEKKLQEEGFSNLNNPFDLSDERVKTIYEKLQLFNGEKAVPERMLKIMSEICKPSWNRIINSVERHISEYEDKTLVIASGLTPYIWGAVSGLEKKFNARYISAALFKLGIEVIVDKYLTIKFNKWTKEYKEQRALDKIQDIMSTLLKVVWYLGDDNIEEFLYNRKKVQNPKNIIIGVEETTLGRLDISEKYLREREEKLYEILSDFLKEVKPNSILYLGQNLNVESEIDYYLKGNLSSIELPPRYKIVEHAKKNNIPVEFGRF